MSLIGRVEQPGLASELSPSRPTLRRSYAVLGLIVVAILGAAIALRIRAASEGPRSNVRGLVAFTDRVRVALAANDRERARTEWRAFSDRWLEIEDPIRDLDKPGYQSIEARMQDVQAALPSEGEWSPQEVRDALADLDQACATFVQSEKSAGSVSHVSSQAPVGREALLDFVARARAAREACVACKPDALDRTDDLRERWTGVEPLVAARDKSAYATSEECLAQARAALTRQPRDHALAARTLERLEKALEPVAASHARYGVIDAAAILLREGAEALLVLAALAAYLGRLGARDRTRLVWLGGAVGLAASLVLGLALAKLFLGVVGGARRELLEGLSSLAAAVLLVVVGQWLHGKMSRGGWKKDVAEALREGNGLSLAAVAFLAVFREGGETVLFYAGIAPSIEGRDLLIGIAVGFVGLAVLGWIVLRLGKKLPLGPFFAFATALLWVLAVKFTGAGVHALQAAGTVSATPVPLVPECELLGIAPTLETCLAQGAALLVWAGFAVSNHRRRSRASA